MSENTGLFTFVVSFFATWGWQTLGKIPDPATGKQIKNLQQTDQIIKILEMLREKTRGNLTAEESRILESTIADLQLNYVEEMEKEKKKEASQKTDDTAAATNSEQKKEN